MGAMLASFVIVGVTFVGLAVLDAFITPHHFQGDNGLAILPAVVTIATLLGVASTTLVDRIKRMDGEQVVNINDIANSVFRSPGFYIALAASPLVIAAIYPSIAAQDNLFTAACLPTKTASSSGRLLVDGDDPEANILCGRICFCLGRASGRQFQQPPPFPPVRASRRVPGAHRSNR